MPRCQVGPTTRCQGPDPKLWVLAHVRDGLAWFPLAASQAHWSIAFSVRRLLTCARHSDGIIGRLAMTQSRVLCGKETGTRHLVIGWGESTRSRRFGCSDSAVERRRGEACSGRAQDPGGRVRMGCTTAVGVAVGCHFVSDGGGCVWILKSSSVQRDDD